MYVNVRAIIEREIGDRTQVIVQTRNKPGEPHTLELPGGQLEEYESLLDCLKREVLEETGLSITKVEGMDTKLEATASHTIVECIQPFAVYQTTKGPIDSMGVYFRCQAEGMLIGDGDYSKDVKWIDVEELNRIVTNRPEEISWVDRAGILFYLKRK